MSDHPLDIVAEGYDAGIRLGEVIDKDMIAVPVSGDLRLVVVGAPSYFARRQKPTHPRDLVEHDCINWHPTAEAPPYRWEFTQDGRDFSVDVRARVLTNDPALNVRLARAGAGSTTSQSLDTARTTSTRPPNACSRARPGLDRGAEHGSRARLLPAAGAAMTDSRAERPRDVSPLHTREVLQRASGKRCAWWAARPRLEPFLKPPQRLIDR